MSETFRIRLDDQESHDYTVKTFEEITVGEYMRIVDGHLEKEEPHETLSRVFGVPSRIARVMRLHEIYWMLSAYTKLLEDGKAAWMKAHDIRALLQAEDEETKTAWTAERAQQLLKEASLHRETIEVDGETFRVLQQIEVEGNYGQWMDLKSVTSEHKESETALYPKVLAIFCLKEGEGYGPPKEPGEGVDAYDARFSQWLHERRELMLKARMIDAQAACAFFFSSSIEFRETTRQAWSFSHLLNPLLSDQAEVSTASDGGSTLN